MFICDFLIVEFIVSVESEHFSNTIFGIIQYKVNIKSRDVIVFIAVIVKFFESNRNSNLVLKSSVNSSSEKFKVSKSKMY